MISEAAGVLSFLAERGLARAIKEVDPWLSGTKLKRERKKASKP
jgi:hypothetical protein